MTRIEHKIEAVSVVSWGNLAGGCSILNYIKSYVIPASSMQQCLIEVVSIDHGLQSYATGSSSTKIFHVTSSTSIQQLLPGIGRHLRWRLLSSDSVYGRCPSWIIDEPRPLLPWRPWHHHNCAGSVLPWWIRRGWAVTNWRTMVGKCC